MSHDFHERAQAAFDAESFRAEAHAAVDQLADYLAQATRGDLDNVYPWHAPEVLRAEWGAPFSTEGGEDLSTLLGDLLNASNHLHHPRYIGHQVCAPLPITAVAGLAAALLNNGMAVYEMGPAGVAMEQAVVRWMAQSLGFDEKAGGTLTSGGSAGTLTALLAMRSAMQTRHSGNGHAGALPCVLVSDQAHYAVKRAVQIMGWGDAGAQPVATDARYRLRPDALAAAHAQAEAAGRKVYGVVGNACSTATGSYDPLNAIADYCAEHGLWFHVDAAHGGAACLSGRHRHLLDGVARADSVVWDAHKMLLTPALVSAVLFRREADSYLPYQAEASYLYRHQAQDEWYNLGHRTLECTKYMAAFRLYAALRQHGTQFFADYVATIYDRAQAFAHAIDAAPDLELGCWPDANIVCFRYAPGGTGDVSALQTRIRDTLLREGSFYIVQTGLRDGTYLRCTLINPLTTQADLHALLARVRTVGQEALRAAV